MRHPLSRSARPRLEPLEGRDVPAGNVTATLVGGRLALTGDDQANGLTLQVTPTQVTVTPESGTTVNGQDTPVTLTGAARSLAANLRGGDDSLSIDPNSDFALAGAANINLGDGNNTLELTTTQHVALGGLVVTSGPGSNTVTVNPGVGTAFRLGTVTSRAVFAFGPGGTNTVNLQNTNFLGAAGVRVTAGSGGANEVTAANLTVTRTLSVNTGRTVLGAQRFTNVTLGGLALTGAFPFFDLLSSTISGNVSDVGTFEAQGSTVNVTVTGNVTIRSASNSSLITDFAFTARNVSVSSADIGVFEADRGSATLNGNLLVTAPQAQAAFSTSGPSEVKGNVAVRGGGITTSFSANGNFQADRNVTVTAAPNSKSTSISIGDPAAAGAAIGGRLTVTTGNGPLNMALTSLTVGGATRITTGAGADTLTIDATTFTGAFTANTGAGDDTVNIAQQFTHHVAVVTFGGRAVINAGPGNDSLRLGLSRFSFMAAVFDVPTSVLNGGIGLNTYFASTAQVFGLTPANFLNWTNA